MARKEGFNDYKIRDLTKGLNLTDYSAKIGDEQCLVCKNWNIEGNKLVTTKGKKLIYTGDGSLIQGMTKDGEDLYYIKNSNIYKNGAILYSGTYDLSVTTIDGYVFGLNVDGTKYITKIGPFGNETTAKSTLLTTLQTWVGAGYTITQPTAGNYHIVNNAGDPFSVSKYTLGAVIENPSSWDVSMKFDILIDSTTTINILPGLYNTFSDVKTYIVSQLPSGYLYQYLSSGLLIARDDGVLVTISITNGTTYTSSLTSSNFTIYPGIGNQYQQWDYTTVTVNGTNYVTDGSNTYDFRGLDIVNQLNGTASGSWTVSNYQGTTTSVSSGNITMKLSGQINTVTTFTGVTNMVIKNSGGTTIGTGTGSGDGNITFSSPVDVTAGQIYTFTASAVSPFSYYTYFNSTPEHTNVVDTFNGLGAITGISMINLTSSYTPISGYTKSLAGNTVTIHKTDYSSISLSAISHWVTYSPPFPDSSLGITVVNTTYISTVAYFNYDTPCTITNNSLGLYDGALYSIYKSPYGLLLVSERGTNSLFIGLTGTVTNLTTLVGVGNPTVGTVYKGKTILGGYDGTDGIVFSKTADLLNPGNAIVFSGYNSGNQSVSGGNTGIVTGMVVSEDGLYIFKDNEIWLSNKENDAEKKNTITGAVEWTFNFLFDKVTSNGCMSNYSIATGGQNTFYFDYKNRAMRVLQKEQNYSGLRDNNISLDIEPILKSIPDDTDSIIYSKLISVNYSYPLLELSFPDSTATDFIYYNYPSTVQFIKPNRTFVYNIISGGWYEKDEYDNLIISTGGYYGDSQGNVYKSNDLNTNILKEGEYLSGELKLTSDVEYKKLGSFYVYGNIEGQKTLTIELLKDGENIVIGDEITPTQRIISGPGIIGEKIDLYEQGIQKLQYKLISDDGDGKINLSEVGFSWKPDNSFVNYY